MKNFILMMCIVAYASIFSSCSNDDSATASTNQFQAKDNTSELRPILPIKPTVSTGTITGSFFPVVPATVIAIPRNSKDIKFTGYMRETGLFKIAPVPVGTYTVWILPKDSPLQPISATDIEVRADQTTDVGRLSFYVEQ